MPSRMTSRPCSRGFLATRIDRCTEGEGRRQRGYLEKEGKESSLYKDWSESIPHEASAKQLGWMRHPILENMETRRERKREREREKEREKERDT